MAEKRKSLNEEIINLDKKFDKAAFGFDPSKQDSNLDELEARVRANLKSINSYSLNGEDGDIVAFFDRVLYRGKGSSGKIPKGTKSAANQSRSFLDDVERGNINLFYGDEANRFMRYKSINAICSMVPELARAISMYRDMIMSPNSFTGASLLYEVEDNGEDNFAIEEAQNSLKKLDEKYKFSEEIAPKAIGNLIKYGDSFTVVLNFKEEIEKLMREAGTVGHESAAPSLLTQAEATYDGSSLASEDVQNLNDFFNISKRSREQDEVKRKAIKSESFTAAEWEKSIDDYMRVDIKNSVVEGLLADEVELYKELKTNPEFASESGDSLAVNLSGSIIRQLEPNKTIKVEIGGATIGYYYLDVTFNPTVTDPFDTDPYGCPACDLTYTTNRVYSFMNHANSGMLAKDNRLQTMTDIFAKRLATKMNRKFIAKNSQFRDFIYTMLKANRAINKTSITFITPKNMIHMKRGSYTYGESMLDPVLYFAKLYVLSILAAIMQQVINGKDKTVYYIETGLDEDAEGAVNSFIADMKGREVTLDDFQDVTAIFNRVTKANALYIPVVDGKKAVEMDTFAGQEAQLNNDFLEFLKRSVINGSGIPASFLDSMSEVEFATTLIMQNGNVMKTVVSYQNIISVGFTEIFTKLQANEGTGKAFSFKVKYADPTILDNRKTEEEIGKVQTITEFIVNTIMGEQPSEEDEKSKPEFKKEIAKKLMSQLNWEDYELIYNAIKKNTKINVMTEAKRELDATEPQNGGEEDDQGSGGSWS